LDYDRNIPQWKRDLSARERAGSKKKRLMADAKREAALAEIEQRKASRQATPPPLPEMTYDDLEPDYPTYVKNYQYDCLLHYGEEEEIRGIVRRMVVNASGRLTSEKITSAAKAIWRNDQKWRDQPNWQDAVISELRIRNPECFDGRKPDSRPRKSAESTGKGCIVILAAFALPVASGFAWLVFVGLLAIFHK
jgi:hypothetical protein